LKCVADAEFSGLSVDSSFFSKLRQNIKDRQLVIEHYYKSIFGSKFNINSPIDISNFKKKIINDLKIILNSNVYHFEPKKSNQSNKSSAWNSGKENEAVEDALKTALLGQLITKHHPLLRLLSEHRSHSHILPICSAILGSRHFSRVKPVYQTLGTDTGRIMITNPPLQQVIADFKFVFH
jgi:DNA polymerase I-like protein with 3'-5' exonuclease and polymerase domains